MYVIISDVCNILGLSRRQVRYMIEKNQIKAKRENSGRWLIEKDSLPMNEEQKLRYNELRSQIKDTVEKTFGVGKKNKKRVYSVLDLKCFTSAQKIINGLREKINNKEHVVIKKMRTGLGQLSCGYHSFHKKRKIEYFCVARESFCLALCDLILMDEDQLQEFITEIECELLPSMGGILRSLEKRR